MFLSLYSISMTGCTCYGASISAYTTSAGANNLTVRKVIVVPDRIVNLVAG